MHNLITKIKAITAHGFLHSTRKAGKAFGVSKSSVAKWLKMDHDPNSRKRKLRGAKYTMVDDFIRNLILEEPRVTLDHIASKINEKHEMDISRSSVHRALKRMGFSNKTTSQCWTKQEVDLGHPFFENDPYDDDAIISIDESGFCVSSRPTRGWGPKGDRVHRGKPPRRRRLSAIVAINKRGIVAQELVYGGVNGAAFASFLQKIPDGSRVLLDNCSIHKSAIVREAMAEKGIRVKFIPPYSPWFNPIENVFGQAKSHFRKARLAPKSLECDVNESFQKVVSFEGMFRSSRDKWKAITSRCE